jgi:PIN domain nuclease of toxin-antitoxin system
METIYLDTYAAVWLYAGETRLFTPMSMRMLDKSDIALSPAVLLEMQFLKEIGKISFKVDSFLRVMQAELGIRLCDRPFASVVMSSVELSWTRDPFDRLIVAQAVASQATLITKDRRILEHYPHAVW